MLTPLPAVDLAAMLDDDDFAHVFGEATEDGNTEELGFTTADVAELYLVEYGAPDAGEWRAIGRLNDGRYFRVSGGCDYTGWDCRASNEGETWPDLGAFVAGIGDADRALLGLGLDGLGSTVVKA